MRPDKFGIDGHYTVSSLYFENPDHAIYFETKNKLSFRQKLGLRVYNDADLNSAAFFDVKQKHNKVVSKRRMLSHLHQAYGDIKYDKRIHLVDYLHYNLQVF